MINSGGDAMPRLCSVIIAFIVFTWCPARAQILTPEELAACKPDFEKYCGGKVPDSGRVVGCLVTGPWSDACKKAQDDFEKRRKAGTKKENEN
jgi:hypothetical protein